MRFVSWLFLGTNTYLPVWWIALRNLLTKREIYLYLAFGGCFGPCIQYQFWSECFCFARPSSCFCSFGQRSTRLADSCLVVPRGEALVQHLLPAKLPTHCLTTFLRQLHQTFSIWWEIRQTEHQQSYCWLTTNIFVLCCLCKQLLLYMFSKFQVLQVDQSNLIKDTHVAAWDTAVII